MARALPHGLSGSTDSRLTTGTEPCRCRSEVTRETAVPGLVKLHCLISYLMKFNVFTKKLDDLYSQITNTMSTILSVQGLNTGANKRC
jgi:hypothetical protein